MCVVSLARWSRATCEVRARCWRRARGNSSARGVALAVFTAARGARAAIHCKTARCGVCGVAQRVAYVSGHGFAQLGGCYCSSLAGEAARPEAEVFRPNATHASWGASLRVAGVLWRFIAGLQPAEAHSQVPVRESRRRLAIVRSRRWGSLRPWIEYISYISRSRPAVLVFLGIS